MHAVLCVDLQAVAVVGVLDEFVHTRGAVAAFGAGVLGQVQVHRHARILQRQVSRLLLLVVGVADEHAAQPVEADLAVRLGVADLRALGGGFQGDVVGLRAVQGPGWGLEAQLGQQPLFDAVHQRADDEALLEPLLEVARLVQLFEQPAALEGCGVGLEFVVATVVHDGVECSLGSQHAGLDGGMAALDAAGVEVARFAADQRAAREHRLGQAQNAAGRDGPRAITDALAAFEEFADFRVQLPALKLLERAKPGVAVVQADDEAERDLVLVQVVQKRAPIRRHVQRPAGGVHHQAGLVLGRVDFPQLLQADAITLRVFAVVKLEAVDDLFAQVYTMPISGWIAACWK